MREEECEQRTPVWFAMYAVHTYTAASCSVLLRHVNTLAVCWHCVACFFSLQATETDDEKVMLPMYMRCEACHGVAHQGALSLQNALEKRQSGDLVSATAIEALQVLAVRCTCLWC